MKQKPTYQELENQLKKLSTAVKQSASIILITNNNGIIEYVNDKFVETTGYLATEVIGQNPRILNAGKQPKEYYEKMWETIKAGNNWKGEFCNKTKNGKIYWEQATITPIKDENNNIINFLGVKENISDRKKTEESLSLFKKITDSTSGHMSFIDTNYVYREVNNSYIVAHNKKREEVVGHTIAEVLGNEVFENFVKNKIDACLSGEIVKYENWFDFVGIGRRYMEVSYYPYTSEDNIISGVIVDSYDITDRKKAEEALKIEHNRFKSILGISPSGIYIIDKQFNIEYINPVIEKEFGQIKGRKCYSYLHNLTKPCDWCKNDEVFAGKSVRWEWYSKNNKKHYDLFDTPLKNPDGTVSKFELFFDITERKNAEQALLKSKNLLQEAQKIAHLGHWELDLINNKLSWSDEVYRIFDLVPQEFDATYESFLENIHPDDRDKVNKAYTNSLKTKLPYEIEHRLLTKSGIIKYVIEKCVTKYNKDGDPIHSLGTVLDITERKNAENELKSKMEELEIFNEVAVDRELLVNDLRNEINILLNKYGEENKYDIVQ